MGIVVEHGADISGTTAQRPTNISAGQRFFDTTIGKQLVYSGTAWVDANGGTAAARGDGAKNGATVSVAETGDGAIHKTVLTLASTPVSIVSVTTGAGVGGTKIYDFPAGRILILGCMAALSLAVAEADEEDYTDGTPEGQIGIGTVAPANADALGTDATDDNLATAADFTMTDFVDASVNCVSEPSIQIDGTSQAVDAYVNALVDAGDIDDDTTTPLLVSGTVTIHWLNLGDL